MSGNAPSPTIDLAKPRVLSLKDRGRTFLYTFNPITPAQWREYFSAIVSTSESQGKDIVRTSDTGSAKLGLVRSTLVSAEGWTMAGDVDIQSVEGWRDKLPSSHRMALGDLLVSTTPFAAPGNFVDDEEDLFNLSLGEERVEIGSVWTVDAQGANQRFGPLVHYFDSPSPDQQRRYLRDSSRSKIRQGFRNGVTQWMGSQMTLAKLYDELVTRVEGYVFDGRPLEGREQIAAGMDTFHKVVAAYQIFSPAEVES